MASYAEPRCGKQSSSARPDAAIGARNWPSFCVAISSSHPHHHPLGVGVVVEEDDRRLGLAPADLAEDTRGLLELVAVRRLPEVERDGLLADR